MGDPFDRDFSEYEFDPSIKEHRGFSIADDIVIVHDDPHEMYSEEETGTVVGFSEIPPAESPEIARAFGNDPRGRTAIYVLMDGTDEPIEVRPEHMEVDL
jgi:hypothetical protein